MDFPEVKAFNAELSGLYDNKPPISKAKMSAITRGAIKAIKFYKHVVHSVEKFIQKCKPEYKVPGLYVIDSIVRQSRHQFGQDKDVFAPRFAKNMQQTFANLFRCPPENKGNIIRVLNLWQKNNVFGPEVIQPLMDMADPNHPLHQEIQQQQNNTANGSSMNLNASHNSDKKISPAPAPLHTPPDHSPMGDSFQDQPSGNSGVKFNRKLLNDFEYESEDDSGAHEPPHSHAHAHAHATHTTHNAHASQQQTADTLPLGSILTNPEIMRQLQSLQAQMQLMTGMQIPNLMPMMSDMQMQQNQNQNAPFLNKDQQKQNESKDDMVESDIEFVETGPQVIEIPDANDSRSPSPRRRRSRSPKRRRRSRSRSRSRSPRRRRDKDRERDRDRDRPKDRERSHKDREADKEKQREREKKGLPPIKKENLSVCSTTLWVGHLSKLATQEELSDLFGAVGGVVSIDVVPPRGCAFVVMERRRDAHKALTTLNKHKLHSKEITVAWAPGKGVKGREWKDYWEAELGVSYLPWGALHARWALGALSLDALEDGGAVDEDTLPPWLPPRIIPKSMLDGMGMLGLPGAAMPPLPAALPSLPLAPPGMTPGIPPGMPPGMPPGIRPPSLPTGVPGLQPEAGALLRFPGMPQPMPAMQPGLPQLPGFLGGLLSVGGLVAGVPLHHQQHQQHQHHAQQVQAAATNNRVSETTRTDDAMELDGDEAPAAPPLLSDQLQALLSKPPPNFNSSEPPPSFNMSEPPPFPQPAEDKDDDKKERDKERRDRDRDRRDRDRGRERGRDRARDRDRERGSRDRERDRGGGERSERNERGGSERGGSERGERGARDRRDRDRDRDRSDRDRFNPPRDNNSERTRSKSPQGAPAAAAAGGGGEKSLQERLWEMANGKRDDFPPPQEALEENRNERGPPLDRMGRPPLDAEGDKPAEAEGGWTALPPRLAAPHPPFRAELRMRGPPRQPMRGPWMDGPRFNGIGPFNRPPFDGPIFDGPPRFERPPFNRMPFDGPNRPPFDGPRPPFDGPRPPFDGPRPPFDGPRPFDGPPFDGPPFDGPPEFFDRNNRRFEDREFNDRGWNGDRDRDREWDRRSEWDERRRDRFRDREHEDRFNRDRNDRRRNFDDRGDRPDRPERGDRTERDRVDKPDRDRVDKPDRDKSDKSDKDRRSRDERKADRQKDRKSRWGAAETAREEAQSEETEPQPSAEQAPVETMEVEKTQVETTESESVAAVRSDQNESERENRESERENADEPIAVEKTVEPTMDIAMETAMDIATETPAEKAMESEASVVESRDEPVMEREQEPSHNEVPEQESKESFEPKDTETESKFDSAPDLYDANEVVDTSFSIPVEKAVVESEKPVLDQTQSKTEDIFDQPKEAEKNTDSKETLETP